MQTKKINPIFIIGGIVLTIFSLLVIFIIQPVLAFGFYSPFIVSLIFFGILTFIFLLSVPKIEKYGFEGYYNEDFNKKIFYYKPFSISFGLTILSFLMITIVPFISSTSIVFSDNYKNLIGNIKQADFTDSKLQVSLENIRIIDEENAKLLGEKKLGEDLGLGSRVEVGTYNIQKVNNQLYWIAPLEYKSFFKWLNDEDGTEGYVMVSAQNSEDVKMITEVNGEKLSLKYLKSAYGKQYLDRHLYFNGYYNIGLTDYTFEIDDNLNPYYVITTFEKTIGYNGENATGVLIVNVQNGEIKQYSINEIPKWVDRVQPENFITTQLNDWGKYIHGWWNSISFSEQKDVVKLTQGQKLVYVNDGNSYWYSGVTSIGKDNSIIGFLLTNTRNKETFFYKQSGATEKAAMRSAEGKVQEKEYNATFPSLYKIAGVPTYVMTLKDREGLVKLFAMVSVEKYDIVGIGTTLKNALRDYKSLLNSNGSTLSVESEATLEKIEGRITRINADIRKGSSYYYLKINESSLIFIGSSNISDKLPLTRIGDNVIIKYMKQSEKIKVIDLNHFDNLDL